MEKNKKDVAQEELVQEQQVKMTIKITNLNELLALINEINNKLKQLTDFKLKSVIK